jgi:hypothetical protein
MGKTNIQTKPNHEVDAELKLKLKPVSSFD